MQQAHDRPPATVGEPSRRRPPRQRVAAPLPIPETPQRPVRSVRLQDVLDAHLRAVDQRIEEGVRAVRTATTETIRQAAIDIRGAPARNGALAQADALRGVLTHAEERFQAITLRLQRLEGALRQLARAQREAPRGGEPDTELAGRIEALARSVAHLAATQRRAVGQAAETTREAIERLAGEHRRAVARLATEHRLVASWVVEQQRLALGDLRRRTGRGVVAVARRLQRDLEARIDAGTERRGGAG
jgi:hypothetical protein